MAWHLCSLANNEILVAKVKRRRCTLFSPHTESMYFVPIRVGLIVSVNTIGMMSLGAGLTHLTMYG